MAKKDKEMEKEEVLEEEEAPEEEPTPEPEPEPEPEPKSNKKVRKEIAGIGYKNVVYEDGTVEKIYD